MRRDFAAALSWLAYGLGAVVKVTLLAFWALERPANLFAVANPLLLVVEPGFNSARALEKARLLISQMSTV